MCRQLIGIAIVATVMAGRVALPEVDVNTRYWLSILCIDDRYREIQFLTRQALAQIGAVLTAGGIVRALYQARCVSAPPI